MTTTASKASAFMTERMQKAKKDIEKEMGITPEARETESSPSEIAGKAKKTLELNAGQKKFSEVFGYKPVTLDQDIPVTCYKPEDWDESVKGFIPTPSGRHVWPEAELEELVVGMEIGDNIWVSGPTGSGKSTLIKEFCAAVGRPFIRFNGREDIESGPIFGQMSAKDGTTHWHDGGYTTGFRQGAVVLMDEATVIPSGIMMGLQWTLEPDGKLLLVDKPGNTEEQLVERDPRFRVVFADNTKGLGDMTGAHAATNMMNTATLDRFGTSIHVGYLSVKAEQRMLSEDYPDIDKMLIKLLVKFANLIRKSYQQGELALTVSPRALDNICKKISYHGSLQRAVISSYSNKLDETEEIGAVQRHFRTVFGESLT